MKKIISLATQVEDILNSTSWKISKPARFVFKKVESILNLKK